jgi:hypothetical protein
MTTSSDRTPSDVLQDHLDKAKQGSVEHDISKNYVEDVVLLTGYGVHKGHEGVRFLAKLLEEQLPGAHFQYETVQVEKDIAFLEWTASADNGATVNDGADSFVIRHGQIVAQTIHYTVS